MHVISVAKQLGVSGFRAGRPSNVLVKSFQLLLKLHENIADSTKVQRIETLRKRSWYVRIYTTGGYSMGP